MPDRKPAVKAPTLATMQRWLANGIAYTPDGCKVEPDGTCPHGERSWFLIRGVI